MKILVSGLFSAADSYGSGTATVEIIVMLLVAFILGYLLRWMLSKNNQEDCSVWKDKYNKLEGQFGILRDENNKLKIDLENCKSNEKLAFVSNSSKSVEPEKKDDLKIVEGIGPKIEQLLFDGGIYTWKTLSITQVSVIQEILDNAGPRYKIHNPETWPEQAKLAAEGKWDELKKWQDELKGGRRV